MHSQMAHLSHIRPLNAQSARPKATCTRTPTIRNHTQRFLSSIAHASNNNSNSRNNDNGNSEASMYPDPFPGLDPGDDLPADYGHVGPSPPKHRRAGVILHPTSLPGPFGIGEIGSEAFKFVDWLESAGMQLWQVGRFGMLAVKKSMVHFQILKYKCFADAAPCTS